MLKSLLVPLLLAFVVGIDFAYAGGAEYENRANMYWLQFYITTAIIVGIIATAAIIVYKFMRGKLSIYKKTSDMRKNN